MHAAKSGGECSHRILRKQNVSYGKKTGRSCKAVFSIREAGRPIEVKGPKGNPFLQATERTYIDCRRQRVTITPPANPSAARQQVGMSAQWSEKPGYRCYRRLQKELETRVLVIVLAMKCNTAAA